VATTELAVWLGDARVATLGGGRPGRVACRYTDAALATWPGNTPVLSCSLPLGSRPRDAFAFATGLLPEGQHRRAMAELAGVTTLDVIGLLDRFGRDVAGALVIGADDPPIRDPRVEPLSEAQLIEEVAALGSERPLGLHDDSELSIAGLADKMLVVRLGPGSYGRPVHGAPSTHILKVDDRVRRGLVRAEHACLSWARLAGLRAARSDLVVVGAAECIVVERFDRAVGADGTITRIHQEDACQALAVDPDGNQRRAKYERYGGPTYRDVAALLHDWAADPEAELLVLADAAAFTIAIGNADAHGKNVGLLHPTPGVVELAPLYDTVPTVLWPTLRAEAAMSVGGVWVMTAITVDDVVREASSWGLSRALVRRRLTETLERLRSVLDDVDVDTAAREVVGERLGRLLTEG
jgi:serine/threonine-protein kinase HipA